MPAVFPEVPSWQIGSVESWQSVLPVHIVVHAAKIWVWFEQLKHVVLDAHGFPHSGAKVVQMPCRHVTPGVALNGIFEPSSVVGWPSPQPQRGYVASHFGSRSWYWACAEVRIPMNSRCPQQLVWWTAARQSPALVHDRSNASTA